MVDLILHLTLDDIDPSSDDLDNITITLKCRHTFTVETLDGVCELAKAYERDATGNVWSRLLLSSETFVKTPCCPTCRAPITARRYGRLTKRGNLDLLERNVATKMARELASLQATFHGIDRAALETGVQDFAPRSDFVLSDKALQGTQKKRDQYTRPSRKEPVLPVDLLGRHMQSICGLHRVECNRWVTTMKPLLNLYQKVHTLSCQRTAHSSAYEASFSMIYEYELMLARHGPHPPRHPETFALQVAKTKVGMAPPRADTRFQVEAIWMSIDIRVLIAGFAEKLFSNLVEKKEASPAQLLAWANFITFIHNSCFHDASCAAEIARTTSAHRQELLSGLRMFKATWRRTQFSVIIDQSRPEGLTMDERNGLAQRVERHLLATRGEALRFKRQCISGGRVLDNIVRDDFDGPLGQCFNHWQQLIDTLNRPSVFYQAVSDEERRQVVGSFTEYSHRGHWYTCPNGHIFTIADCGGAVTTSRCNECGATIGGSGHQIAAGVRQATNLEQIAASQGARQSPWAWNGNV